MNVDFEFFLWPVLAPGEGARIGLPVSFVRDRAMFPDPSTADYLNRHGFEVFGNCTDRARRQRYAIVAELGSAGPYQE